MTFLRFVGPALVGVASGALTSLVLREPGARSTDSQSTVGAGAIEDTHQPQRTLPGSAYYEPEGNPENSASLVADARSATDPTSAAEPPPAVSPAEEEAQDIARHATRLEEHRAQPRDSSWAAQSEKQLQGALVEVSKHNDFRLLQVDCRSTTCSALVEWDSYEKTRAAWKHVLHDFTFNCGRTLVVPAPSDPSAPYQTTVLYDCSTVTGNEGSPIEKSKVTGSGLGGAR